MRGGVWLRPIDNFATLVFNMLLKWWRWRTGKSVFMAIGDWPKR